MDFEIAFADKETTPWGGMALMKRMYEQGDDGLQLDEFI